MERARDIYVSRILHFWWSSLAFMVGVLNGFCTRSILLVWMNTVCFMNQFGVYSKGFVWILHLISKVYRWIWCIWISSGSMLEGARVLLKSTWVVHLSGSCFSKTNEAVRHQFHIHSQNLAAWPNSRVSGKMQFGHWGKPLHINLRMFCTSMLVDFCAPLINTKGNAQKKQN